MVHINDFSRPNFKTCNFSPFLFFVLPFQLFQDEIQALIALKPKNYSEREWANVWFLRVESEKLENRFWVAMFVAWKPNFKKKCFKTSFPGRNIPPLTEKINVTEHDQKWATVKIKLGL